MSADENMEFCGVQLVNNSKIKSISCLQFLQSLVNSLSQRMSASIYNNEVVVEDLKVLDKLIWPEHQKNICYGEAEHKHFSQRFSIPETEQFLG